MQSKEELEKWHEKPDAWGYESNPDDILRKHKILNFLTENYARVLDIGAAEGWITKDLPGGEIEAIEVSDNAASRFPAHVTRVTEPEGDYDLICCMGSLYQQYDHAQIAKWIKEHAVKHVLITGIKDWLIDYDFGEIIKQDEFNYHNAHNYVQQITLYSIA